MARRTVAKIVVGFLVSATWLAGCDNAADKEDDPGGGGGGDPEVDIGTEYEAATLPLPAGCTGPAPRRFAALTDFEATVPFQLAGGDRWFSHGLLLVGGEAQGGALFHDAWIYDLQVVGTTVCPWVLINTEAVPGGVSNAALVGTDPTKSSRSSAETVPDRPRGPP